MTDYFLSVFDQGAGWFMGYAGPLELVYMDDRLTDASFDRYVAALARDIDARSLNANVAIYYHVTAPELISSRRRQQIGSVLAARKEKTAVCTAGYAAYTPTMIGRGVLTAVFWLAPPPYPHKVCANADEAMRFLASRRPDLDVAQAVSAHERAWARFSAPPVATHAKGA